MKLGDCLDPAQLKLHHSHHHLNFDGPRTSGSVPVLSLPLYLSVYPSIARLPQGDYPGVASGDNQARHWTKHGGRRCYHNNQLLANISHR